MPQIAYWIGTSSLKPEMMNGELSIIPLIIWMGGGWPESNDGEVKPQQGTWGWNWYEHDSHYYTIPTKSWVYYRVVVLPTNSKPNRGGGFTSSIAGWYWDSVVPERAVLGDAMLFPGTWATEWDIDAAGSNAANDMWCRDRASSIRARISSTSGFESWNPCQSRKIRKK